MTDTRPRCAHHVVFPAANCPECMRAEIERLRALLKRVLSCGLCEEPHGYGFTPSRQERVASQLTMDINTALRSE